MAFRALVKVGNYELPEPSTYSGNTSTLVDSSRNSKGYMIGSVIRDDVGKVSMTWKYLSIQDWANINKCFKESVGGKFINTVEFFDQSVGDWVIKSMYISDRKAGMWRRNAEGDVLGWTDCQLSLVEV